MKIKTKVIRKHRKGCRALKHVKEKTWSTPWSFIEKGALYRDINGGLKSDGHRWITTRCNCTDCPGKLMVLERDLLNLLPLGEP